MLATYNKDKGFGTANRGRYSNAKVDALLEEAHKLTGLKERTALIHEGLRALIARESGRRLARLGATERRVRDIPRRRTGSK